jgi:hypothetical protein
VCALVACAACGRIGFLLTGSPGSSGDGGAGTGDGGAGTGDGIGSNGGPDAFVPWDVVPISACGPNIIVSDNFTSTTPGAQWTVMQSPDGMFSQGEGALRITFTSPTQNAVDSRYTLASPVSFANACATIEVGQIPNASTTATIDFTIGTVNMFARFQEAGGTLTSICALTSNSVNHLDTRTFDPIAHRFLRLSEGGSNWSWQVSPDGVTFTTLATNSCSAVANSNVLGLWVLADPGTTNAGGVTFGTVAITK